MRLVLACAALAALSLLLPWALAFDPYAWLVWGREIGRLELDTSAGPSWKPLPVLVTTPLAVLGSGAAEALWLVVARAGALLGVAGAGALAWRLGGGRAGAAGAALVVALGPWWWFNAALGNSEGLLAASVLWAAVAHLAGRERLALTALLAGGLLRPEVWPFLGLYGLWLGLGERRALPLAAASLAAIPLAWFVPGALGGGGASEAAQGPPSAGSAALADVPFLAVLVDAVELLTVPAVLAVLLALATRDRRILLLAAAAAGYVLLVAVMTQAGYAGNPRYLVPAAAVGAALAGAGAGRLGTVLVEARGRRVAGSAGAALAKAATRRERHRIGAGMAAALAFAVAVVQLAELVDQTREIGVRADTRRGLDAIAPRVPAACSRVYTSVAQRSAVAYAFDRPLSGGLDRPPRPPGAVLQARPYAEGPFEPDAPRPPFTPLDEGPRWRLAAGGATCGAVIASP